MSDQTAPNPGTYAEARSEETADRRGLTRESDRDRSTMQAVDDREVMPVPDAERRARPAADEACAVATKGGEHGHELKIRRPAGPARLRQARRRATPLPCRTARGRRNGARCASAKGQVTGLFAEGHPPKGGGIVPRIWFEKKRETFALE
jgi:hypothetical protein